jgi:hypothetical protein
VKASGLLRAYVNGGRRIFDPFSGSGVIPLEAAIRGYEVLASDISPYAYTLTTAKLFPPKNLQMALECLNSAREYVQKDIKPPDLRKIPIWVRKFFNGKTLKEILGYRNFFEREKEYFHLACLMGVLHHQRPGFLSFPASHTTPYLRDKKFPRQEFPELYLYRDVHSRMLKKITRVMRNVPTNLRNRRHMVSLSDIRTYPVSYQGIEACVTSPPYMNNLSYGRDNRLRLWFLGMNDWKPLDRAGYKNLTDFKDLMQAFFYNTRIILRPRGLCILVFGQARGTDLTKIITNVAKEKGFRLIENHVEKVPNVKRVRREYKGTTTESTLVFRSNRA